MCNIPTPSLGFLHIFNKIHSITECIMEDDKIKVALDSSKLTKEKLISPTSTHFITFFGTESVSIYKAYISNIEVFNNSIILTLNKCTFIPPIMLFNSFLKTPVFIYINTNKPIDIKNILENLKEGEENCYSGYINMDKDVITYLHLMCGREVSFTYFCEGEVLECDISDSNEENFKLFLERVANAINKYQTSNII